MKDWRDLITPGKDQPMPKTEEYYKKVLAMDDELIHEQKEEISKLKKKVNQLQMKLHTIKSLY